MTVPADHAAEDLWRSLAPQVLGALVRHFGDFEACEDAVQESLLAAATQWPDEGAPRDPRAWLIRVASRKLIDQRRSDTARVRREAVVASRMTDDEFLAAPPDVAASAADDDDTLTLLMLCCHPSLTPQSQVALTLRAVGGLTTAQIAKAFLVPEATMAQRISRAKTTIRSAGFEQVTPGTAGVAAALHVLYLIFSEGYATTTGPSLHSVELTREAIRLTRMAHQRRPDDGEVAGLLALMLLTDARTPARTKPDGSLVPLDEQDRTLWNGPLIDEGVALITDALAEAVLGPYQIQAAIAAVHDEAATADATDWLQILALYRLLEALAPNPVVTLNRAVAEAMVHGPQQGLKTLASVEKDLAKHHRLHAVRAHLLETAGDPEAARAAYVLAARLTTSVPEQAYLNERADRLRGGNVAMRGTPDRR